MDNHITNKDTYIKYIYFRLTQLFQSYTHTHTHTHTHTLHRLALYFDSAHKSLAGRRVQWRNLRINLTAAASGRERLKRGIRSRLGGFLDGLRSQRIYHVKIVRLLSRDCLLFHKKRISTLTKHISYSL